MNGTVIKQIREDKNLTLEEIYFGVCSKTNAIAFEKGERMLAADKFIQVLDNLMMSLDEFMWIANGYCLSEQNMQAQSLKRTWNVGHLAEFEHQLQISSQSELNGLTLASFRLLHAYSRKEPLDPLDLELVSRYFAELSLWTLADLKLFANICYVLPFSLLVSLLKEALKAKQRYQNYPGSEMLFATILVNCLERTFAEDQPRLSMQLLEKLSETTQGTELVGYRLFERYYRALYQYRYKNAELGKQKLLEVKHIARILDDKLIIEMIKEALC